MFEFWKFVLDLTMFGQPVELLIVIDSVGSSPGRQGFKLAVSNVEGTAGGLRMCGSIGGGIMEHKLVELSRERIRNGVTDILVKRQVHRKDEARDQSGMICSGEQTIVFIPVNQHDLDRIKTVMQIVEGMYDNDPGTFRITANSFEYIPNEFPEFERSGQYRSDEDWEYTERVGFKDCIYIVGGGHVSMALSEMMAKLDFHITVFDERHDLNTMADNHAMHHHAILPYEHIVHQIPEGPNSYVVLVTFGYRSDKVVLETMLDKDYAYLGMMGSRKKVDEMFAELRADGASQERLDRVHAPIGITIGSKTPAEIAISIAAQIIAFKNC